MLAGAALRPAWCFIRLWSLGADNGLCSGPCFGRPLQPGRNCRSLHSTAVPCQRRHSLHRGATCRSSCRCGNSLRDRKGKAGFNATSGFAANGYDAYSPGGYSLTAALAAELVMAFFFLVVILGATNKHAPQPMAGMAIGLALTLIHLVTIPVTNTSVNPARSTGPALFVGGWAIKQLWLFWLAPPKSPRRKADRPSRSAFPLRGRPRARSIADRFW